MSAPLPRLNVTGLADPARHGPLLGYRVFTGDAGGLVYVVRMLGETDAELHARALARLDDKAEEGIVRLVTEIRGE